MWDVWNARGKLKPESQGARLQALTSATEVQDCHFQFGLHKNRPRYVIWTARGATRAKKRVPISLILIKSKEKTKTFLCWGWSSTGAGSPERLQSPSLEILYTQLGNVLSNLVLLQRSPPTSTVLCEDLALVLLLPEVGWKAPFCLRTRPRKFSESRDWPASSLQTAWISTEIQIPFSTKLIAQGLKHCSLQLDAACRAQRTRIREKILFSVFAYLFLDRNVGNWVAGLCSLPPVVCLNLNTGHGRVQSTFCYGNKKIMVISKAIKPS